MNLILLESGKKPEDELLVKAIRTSLGEIELRISNSEKKDWVLCRLHPTGQFVVNEKAIEVFNLTMPK